MKISTNKLELKSLSACASGYQVFVKAHGDKEVKLSKCLESNSWDDIWWLISNTYSQFSKQQKTDLRLLGCEYALIVLPNFEKEFPEDKRPRLAIEASRAFAKGDITEKELKAAAEAAAESAESAAEKELKAAARSAAAAARSAEAAMKINTKMLMKLLIKWESQ